MGESVVEGLQAAEACDSTGTRVNTEFRRESGVRVAIRVPCDIKSLATSPELPKSIFDDGEEIFGSKERDALVKEALAMGAQPPFAIGSIPPNIKWGLEYTRFNRIEGLSTAALLEQPLGAGYTASLLARIGHADLEPNAEIGLARSNLTRTIRGRVYNRLVAANDWGSPLSFGSSVSAFLFGRDEGFYYRASGIELESVREEGAMWGWRLFAEKNRTAAVENEFSLGPKFMPNISARSAGFAGVATRFSHMRGLDPDGFRVFTDLRLEGATSDSASTSYGRGALELTVTQAIGKVAAGLTLSGGSTVGDVPAQRRWYLGGAHTVRGQRADTAATGNAYWLGRLELGASLAPVRPIIFGDVGWVGDRERMREVGRPLSGVGIGASLLDGLVRADLSRGIYPRERFRFDMYLEARF